jgi:hypothetical protein
MAYVYCHGHSPVSLGTTGGKGDLFTINKSRAIKQELISYRGPKEKGEDLFNY